MLHQTFLFLGQLWQLFEASQILEFLRYSLEPALTVFERKSQICFSCFGCMALRRKCCSKAVPWPYPNPKPGEMWSLSIFRGLSFYGINLRIMQTELKIVVALLVDEVSLRCRAPCCFGYAFQTCIPSQTPVLFLEGW